MPVSAPASSSPGRTVGVWGRPRRPLRSARAPGAGFDGSCPWAAGQDAGLNVPAGRPSRHDPQTVHDGL